MYLFVYVSRLLLLQTLWRERILHDILLTYVFVDLFIYLFMYLFVYVSRLLFLQT